MLTILCFFSLKIFNKFIEYMTKMTISCTSYSKFHYLSCGYNKQKVWNNTSTIYRLTLKKCYKYILICKHNGFSSTGG